jgi:hypothetical protein
VTDHSNGLAFLGPRPVSSKHDGAQFDRKARTLVTQEVVDDSNDPNRYINKAMQLAVDNYNSHRDEARTRPLTLADVHVVDFQKIKNFWVATVASTVARSLLFKVTYNLSRSEAVIEVYKKVNAVTIAD